MPREPLQASPDRSTSSLSQMLIEGTAALARLDVPALERLQERALAAQNDQPLRAEPAAESTEAREHLESCRRIFNEVLRSTGEHLKLLQRIGSQGKELPWDR